MLKRGYKVINVCIQDDSFVDATFEIPEEKLVTFRFIKGIKERLEDEGD